MLEEVVVVTLPKVHKVAKPGQLQEEERKALDSRLGFSVSTSRKRSKDGLFALRGAIEGAGTAVCCRGGCEETSKSKH